MGWRIRKSTKIGPFRITASKSGTSVSVGGKGYRITKQANGKIRKTYSIPGTGISYSEVQNPAKKRQEKALNKQLKRRRRQENMQAANSFSLAHPKFTGVFLLTLGIILLLMCLLLLIVEPIIGIIGIILAGIIIKYGHNLLNKE
jgi:Flp pilus assembly protein TadB